MKQTFAVLITLSVSLALVSGCRESHVVPPEPSVETTPEAAPVPVDIVAQVTAVIDSLPLVSSPKPGDDAPPLTLDDVLKIQRNVRAMESDYAINRGCATVVMALAAEIEVFGEAGWEVADRYCLWVSQSGRRLVGREWP